MTKNSSKWHFRLGLFWIDTTLFSPLVVLHMQHNKICSLIVRSRRREISNSKDRIALKFDKRLGSNAAETLVKFQSDQTILNTNLAGSRFCAWPCDKSRGFMPMRHQTMVFCTVLADSRRRSPDMQRHKVGGSDTSFSEYRMTTVPVFQIHSLEIKCTGRWYSSHHNYISCASVWSKTIHMKL